MGIRPCYILFISAIITEIRARRPYPCGFELSEWEIRCPNRGGRVIEAWNAALVMFKAAAGLGRPEGGLEQRELLPIPREGEGLMRLFRDNPYPSENPSPFRMTGEANLCSAFSASGM